jgi:hypothetical protein
MGYHVTIKHSTATIPKKNQNEVLQIWKDLNKPENDHLKRGGAYRDGKKHTAWYSWMPANYHETVESVEDVLHELGFETELGPFDEVLICDYEGKIGQEELFFKQVAHLMTGQIQWGGEDGSTWVWELGKEFAIGADD